MSTKKDPACLFYIDTWLSATAEMDSDVRGWYLNLILHQYDKKDLPNDLEKLAVLAGVKFSEFERFKQMFEQVLKHKFKLNDENRLENDYAKTILKNREMFKDVRSKSGSIGVVIKMAKSIEGFEDNHIETLKKHLYNLNEEEINKHKNKQVLEQMLKLYINENKNENKYINKEIYRKFEHLKISFEEVEKLKADYDIKAIDSILDKIENYKNNKRYKSLYLTAKEWLKKENKNKDEVQTVNYHEEVKKLFSNGNG